MENLLVKAVLQAVIDHMQLTGKVTPDQVLKVFADLKAGTSKDKISPAEIIAAAQAACVVINILDTEVCPLINSL